MPIEVTASALVGWLEALGRCFRHGGRLYLVGGTSLLLAAAKTVTLDVDVQFDVDPAHQTEWVRCVRQVSQTLLIPVEQVSPADFIPLPAGYEERHQYVGRFGRIEVFHFDFYSVALSKIHRGNEKDYADVIAMIEQGLITFQQLEAFFAEVLAEVEARDLRTVPADYARKFELLVSRLRP